MNLIVPCSVKHFDNLVPGELIRVQCSEHGALAIVLGRLQGSTVFYALVEAIDWKKDLPLIVVASYGEHYCTSYGTDWELELIPASENISANHAFNGRPGTIHVTEEGGVILTLITEQDEIKYYDLKGKRLASGPSHFAAPMARWRIWLNQNDRLSGSAKPLLEFVSKPRGASQ